MVIILAVGLLFLTVYIGSFLFSVDFFNGDFKTLYPSILESHIVDQRNFELTPDYMHKYNTDSGDNNYICNGDNDCKFRNVYGFLPPAQKIDIGDFSNISGGILNFNFSGNIISPISLTLTQIGGNYKVNESFFSGGSITLPSFSGNYNIKIKNNSNDWIQFYIDNPGGDGLRSLDMQSSTIGEFSQDFSYYIGRNSILDSNYSYLTGFDIEIGYGCAGKVYSGYILPSMIHLENGLFAKNVSITNGFQTYNMSTMCNNSNFGYGVDTLIGVTCNSGYVQGTGNNCILDISKYNIGY